MHLRQSSFRRFWSVDIHLVSLPIPSICRADARAVYDVRYWKLTMQVLRRPLEILGNQLNEKVSSQNSMEHDAWFSAMPLCALPDISDLIYLPGERSSNVTWLHRCRISLWSSINAFIQWPSAFRSFHTKGNIAQKCVGEDLKCIYGSS